MSLFSVFLTWTRAHACADRWRYFRWAEHMNDRNPRHNGYYCYFSNNTEPILHRERFKISAQHTQVHTQFQKLTKNGLAISFNTALVCSLHHDLVWSDSAKNRYRVLQCYSKSWSIYPEWVQLAQYSWKTPHDINMVINPVIALMCWLKKLGGDSFMQ